MVAHLVRNVELLVNGDVTAALRPFLAMRVLGVVPLGQMIGHLHSRRQRHQDRDDRRYRHLQLRV
jgi:hypothetical protein